MWILVGLRVQDLRIIWGVGIVGLLWGVGFRIFSGLRIWGVH